MAEKSNNSTMTKKTLLTTYGGKKITQKKKLNCDL